MCNSDPKSHQKEMSGQDERQIQQEYYKRTMERPATNWFVMAKWIVKIETIILALTLITYFVLYWPDIPFDSFIQIFWLFCGYSLLLFSLTLKKTLILLIELYQHYAPDRIRRRCMMLPSCSEYGISAIKKYGVAIGVRKTYLRLTQKCKGYYEVDYP